VFTEKWVEMCTNMKLAGSESKERLTFKSYLFTPGWYSLGAQLNCPCILISVIVYSCIFPNCSKHLPVWGGLTWLHISVGCKDVSKPRYRFEHPRPLNGMLPYHKFCSRNWAPPTSQLPSDPGSHE
jgi:hypothetical protein